MVTNEELKIKGLRAEGTKLLNDRALLTQNYKMALKEIDTKISMANKELLRLLAEEELKQ